MSRPPLTVVVPCRDRSLLLDGCLTALTHALSPADEVVVVDSASRDGRVREVAERAGARVVRCAEPGTSRARNAGWRAATTRLVAFVDDDIVVEPDWADALVAALAAPAVGFAAGLVRLPADSDAHGGAAPTSTVTSVRPPEIVRDVRDGVFSGGNLALPVDVLAWVGGFDEQLGPGTWFAAGEDLDLLDRVLAIGRTGRYAEDAVGRHVQWRSPGDVRRLHWAYGKGFGAWVARVSRREPRRGLSLLPELVRLGGLRRLPPLSLIRPFSITGGEGGGMSGVRAPVYWRAGAVVGFVVGLVRLGREPTAQPADSVS